MTGKEIVGALVLPLVFGLPLAAVANGMPWQIAAWMIGALVAGAVVMGSLR